MTTNTFKKLNGFGKGAVSKDRHCALDAQSHRKTTLIVKGVQGKPAMTMCFSVPFETASLCSCAVFE
jgi:hypothetical protein